jgi:hypothetical protein
MQVRRELEFFEHFPHARKCMYIIYNVGVMILPILLFEELVDRELT